MAVAAVLAPHALAGCPGKCLESLRCDSRSGPFDRVLGPLCVGSGLIADGLQVCHAFLEHRIGDVGDSVFNRVVQSLEFGFGCALAQFGDMRRSAFADGLLWILFGDEC